MSRSKSDRRGRSHKEWWGNRPFACLSVMPRGMKYWKRLLHKTERAISKENLFNDLKEQWDLFYGPFDKY